MSQNKSNLEEEIDYFRYAFDNAQNLVEFADSKASILIGVNTLVLTIFLSAIIFNLNTLSDLNGFDIFGLIIGGFATILMIVSIILTGEVIRPRDAIDDKSIFYYKTISRYETQQKYYDSHKDLIDEKIAKGLAHQAYNVSLIAETKMEKVRYSVYAMYGYLVCATISTILLLMGVIF